MRNNVKVAPALSPLSDIYSATLADTVVYMPLHGGGGANINLAGSNAIMRGTTTKLVLGSAASAIAGQMINLSGVTPTGFNGNHKVLWVNGTTVCVDLDSSALTDWSSGGTVAFNYVSDMFGNVSPQPVAGTITGIWANQGDGLTADPTAGSYITTMTTGIDALSLSGFAGIFALSFEFYLGANPTGNEYMFCAGVQPATGTNSKTGNIAASLNSSGQVNIAIRPKTTADGGGTTTFMNLGALTTSATSTIQVIFDLRNPAAPFGYAYLNNTLRVSSAINVTNMIDWWSGDVGFSFGASLSAGSSSTQGSKLGALGSGARIKNLLWMKSTTKSFGEMTAILDALARTKELPKGVV